MTDKAKALGEQPAFPTDCADSGISTRTWMMGMAMNGLLANSSACDNLRDALKEAGAIDNKGRVDRTKFIRVISDRAVLHAEDALEELARTA